MLLTFFTNLRQAKVPVTLREYLTLLQALDADLADRSVEQFYYLSRACLVKDERNLDKFDKVFGHIFKGLEAPAGEGVAAEIPEEWLRKLAENLLTDEEKKLHDLLKDKAAELEVLFGAVKPGRYNALAVTALEQSIMWIVKELTS